MTRLLAKARALLKTNSLVGEISLWSLALLAIGAVAILFAGAFARRSTAANLADYDMVDFLHERIVVEASYCPPDDRSCLLQVYQNETGGIWRFTDPYGVTHSSVTFDVWQWRDKLEHCALARSKRADEMRILHCQTDGGLDYRVAAGPSGDVVALEMERWRQRTERAVSNLTAAQSLRTAIAAMTLTLATLLGVAVYLLRRRFHSVFERLSADLEAYRRGEADRVAGVYPEEISNLVESFNKALEKNASILARQKRNVNKMAHDLRHQLVNIDVASRGEDPAAAEVELRTLDQLVERYLTLMDWVGPAEGRAPQNVRNILVGVQRAYERRLRVEPVEILVDAPETLTARVHPTDLKIILNNLAGNAHKFAKSQIKLAARRDAGRLELQIDDDGPGIPDDQRDALLGWGAALDHGLPGQGFGLTIVAEQVRELYGGETRLETSALGGLRVTVILPTPD